MYYGSVQVTINDTLELWLYLLPCGNWPLLCLAMPFTRGLLRDLLISFPLQCACPPCQLS